MGLRRSILATSTAGIILTASALAFAQKGTPDAVRTGYAPVTGLKLYYEVHGSGEPLMIVFADADAVRTTHIMEFFSLLGGGRRDAGLDGSGRPRNQLAILPGLTHYNMSSSPALATSVTPFLDAPMPGSK